MKKQFSLISLAVLVLALGSCTSTSSISGSNNSSTTTDEVDFFELEETDIGTDNTVDDGKLAELNYTEENPLRIALVTDSGTLNDHSFNESAWNGVNAFAVTNGGGTIGSDNMVSSGLIQTHYYQPAADNYDTQGRLEAMRSANSWGADVIVLPGYLFQSAIKQAIDSGEFDDVHFLAFDCVKEDSDNGNAAYEYTDNITSIIYREEQSGFLAGYAAVKEGYRNLGFLGGMAVPAVVRYGSGYCQGADYAASELGLEDGAINIQYYYAGEFQATTAATQYCTSWYQRGTEVIFGCGGAVYQSVISASQAAGNKPWIGVDVNQHADTSLGQSQDTCITSAMKNLQESTEVLLTTYVQNDLTWGDSLAGEVVTVGAQSESCVLPTPETTGDPDCWGFENFTIEEYDSILAMLKDGSVKVNSNSNNEQLSAHNFGCSAKVSINYIA